jgi:hypothetical protein
MNIMLLINVKLNLFGRLIIMGDRGLFGGIGGILGNETVLWFIILFLLLFWRSGGFGYDDGYCDPK